MMVLLACCSKVKETPVQDEKPQESVSPGKGITYTLTGFLSDKAKAFISDEGDFSWSASDQVAVLDSSSGELCTFTCEDEADGIFTFTGVEGRQYDFTSTKAWYPASMVKAADVISYPASWQYSDLHEARNFPMAASVSNGKMQFHHLGGLLKVIVNDVPANATALTLSSVDVSLSGDFPVTELGLDDGRVDATGENLSSGGDEIPITPTKSIPEIVSGAGEGTVSVALSLSSKEDITVYIPLPCGSYRYKVSLKAGDEVIFERGTSAPKDINRADLVRMSALNPWPATTLQACYGSTTVDFGPSDLWGWYVAKNLPASQSITIRESGDVYGPRFATKKHAGYLSECIPDGVAFALKQASDLYISTDKSRFFPLAAGSAAAAPQNYEAAHYGLRGSFDGGSYASKGKFQKTSDVPEGSGTWYVVRNITCTASPIAFKLYSTAYSADDGLLVTATETPQNVGVSRSLTCAENPAIKYNVTPGMAYDFYLREDLTKIYVCEAGAKASSMDDALTSLSNYGLYRYGGSSYVCTTGIDQSWVTSSSSATFVLVDGITFDQVSLSGLPLSPSVGDNASVGVSVTPSIGTPKSGTVSASVVRVEGSKVWLLSEDGTGMIVNVQ